VGVFTSELEVGDAQATRFQRVSALVDAGASHTARPGSMLRSLGLTPHDRGRFQLADGSIVVREVGRTWVRLDGRSETTIVVFGDEGSMPRLGAVTLEEFRSSESIHSRRSSLRSLAYLT
jgi:predicted aspartyl protease